MFPTRVYAIAIYIEVMIIRDSIIDKGRFLLGFLTSPATAAIFKTPAYEMYKCNCT